MVISRELELSQSIILSLFTVEEPEGGAEGV